MDQHHFRYATHHYSMSATSSIRVSGDAIEATTLTLLRVLAPALEYFCLNKVLSTCVLVHDELLHVKTSLKNKFLEDILSPEFLTACKTHIDFGPSDLLAIGNFQSEDQLIFHLSDPQLRTVYLDQLYYEILSDADFDIDTHAGFLHPAFNAGYPHMIMAVFRVLHNSAVSDEFWDLEEDENGNDVHGFQGQISLSISNRIFDLLRTLPADQIPVIFKDGNKFLHIYTNYWEFCHPNPDDWIHDTLDPAIYAWGKYAYANFHRSHPIIRIPGRKHPYYRDPHDGNKLKRIRRNKHRYTTPAKQYLMLGIYQTSYDDGEPNFIVGA